MAGYSPESHYRTLFERTPVAIWDEDFSGLKSAIAHLIPAGPDHVRQQLESHPELLQQCIAGIRVRQVNRVAREFYGADTEEELIQALPRLFDPEAVKTFIDEIATLAGGFTSYSAELVTSTLRGDRRLVQMNVAIHPTPADDWSQVVVAFTDLTERRRLEQSLHRANERLRRVNADLEQFAYAAAHDLREPLRTITLYAQLLQRFKPEQLDPLAGTAVTYIIESAQRLTALINDLLTYAQAIEPQDLSRCPLIDPHPILTEVLTSIAGSIEETGALVTVDPTLPPIPVQPQHLRQLFQNLLTNALKYRSPLRRAEVGVTAHNTGPEAVFCISDNGIGIHPDHQDQIFGIFNRLHDNEIEGTGIGLALCKQIAEQYGGRIWVESQPDTGSKFYITLPTQPQQS